MPNEERRAIEKEAAIEGLIALLQNYVSGRDDSIQNEVMKFSESRDDHDPELERFLRSIERSATEYHALFMKVFPKALGITQAEFDEYVDALEKRRAGRIGRW